MKLSELLNNLWQDLDSLIFFLPLSSGALLRDHLKHFLARLQKISLDVGVQRLHVDQHPFRHRALVVRVSFELTIARDNWELHQVSVFLYLLLENQDQRSDDLDILKLCRS